MTLLQSLKKMKKPKKFNIEKKEQDLQKYYKNYVDRRLQLLEYECENELQSAKENFKIECLQNRPSIEEQAEIFRLEYELKRQKRKEFWLGLFGFKKKENTKN